jgi:hypothetical protein
VLGTCDTPNGLSGKFVGDVEVTGDIRLTNGQDLAEDFDIGAESSEPGFVMVFDGAGKLHPCAEAYDKKVAGVVAGAGGFKPSIILGRRSEGETKQPIALVGRVECRVDAAYGAIGVGDLLTTSPTPGHAMKATNALQAFGAVIGKALRALDSGRDSIPILVALQ